MASRSLTAVAATDEPMVRQRVRIRFAKQGDLRWIGHRDLMRCMERLFRRAELRLGMSQGFHPKPRVTFPSPLAVGIEGTDEVMELELAETCIADDLRDRLVSQAPPGLNVTSVEVLPEGSRKVRVREVVCQAPVPENLQPGLPAKIDELLALSSCPIQRPKRRTPVDLRPLLSELTFADGVLSMRLRVSQEAGVSPRDVLGVLGLGDLEHQGAHLTRTRVEINA